MPENIFKYAIFLTAWGWAGFAVAGEGLRIFVLPEEKKEDVLFRIKKELKCNHLFEDNRGWENLIQKVKEYYAGKKVDFTDYHQKIPYGETRSYKEVAEAAGYPRAYRAVGSTMRNNPLPLVVPCHRVIKSDGSIGGFSGQKDNPLKKKMIDLESGGK